MYNNWQIIHCVGSQKQHVATNSDINVHIKQNSIRNIALNIFRDIIDEYYDAISIIDKNIESGYYPVKWSSESYNLQSSHKLGKYLIKAGELVCYSVYFNPLANVNKCYTPSEKKNQVKTIVRLNTVI